MIGGYISLKEAQKILGISRVKMWKLAKEGSLPIYTDPLDKRKKLVPRIEVEKLKQPQAVKKETPVQPPTEVGMKKPPLPSSTWDIPTVLSEPKDKVNDG